MIARLASQRGGFFLSALIVNPSHAKTGKLFATGDPMPFSLAQRLQSLGVATRLALEVQRQLAANVGNLKKLMEVGMTTKAAQYLATGITAGTIDARKLAEYSVVPDVAKLIAQGTNAPRNTVLPAITGTAQVGQTLTRTTGTWVGTPAPTLATQWTANGIDIGGATAATYVPIVGQIGQVIRVRVTGTNANGTSFVVSNPTSAVIAA